MERLKAQFSDARWREQGKGEELFKKELVALVLEYGAERVEAAVTQAIRKGIRRDDGTVNRSFMPTIAELDALVPGPNFGKARVAPSDDCQFCGGTGWEHTDPKKLDSAVKRCRCRRVVE